MAEREIGKCSVDNYISQCYGPIPSSVDKDTSNALSVYLCPANAKSSGANNHTTLMQTVLLHYGPQAILFLISHSFTLSPPGLPDPFHLRVSSVS